MMENIIQRGGAKLVIGLGISGFSAVCYLKQQSYSVRVFDTRLQPPKLADFEKQFPDIPLQLQQLQEDFLVDVDEVILSPGLSLHDPNLRKIHDRDIPIIGDIELFCRHHSASRIAITGSNGKSTVTEWIGYVLRNTGHRVAVLGNIGVPVLEWLCNPTDVDWVVLELSSFQLETTDSLQAKIAVLLNVTEDHLDRYPTMQDYWRAKQRVFLQAELGIVCREDPLTRPLLHSPAESLSFGLGPADMQDWGVLKRAQGDFFARGIVPLVPVDSLKLQGRHNQLNALAVMATVAAAGIAIEKALPEIVNFSGLKHRCQPIAKLDDILWIDDSKGTNVGATQAALRGLARPGQHHVIWIAGGVGKGADFSPLGLVAADRVKVALLIGEDREEIAHVMSKHNVPFLYCDSMKEAVLKAHFLATFGDTVLLSPACASFDMFKDYKHRGESFAHEIKALKQLFITQHA
ncbi:MAG: UDP-N-acetylmuramoyl-L-alanine--D-glutamate ligase [Pseudomonadota bacterium]